MGEGGTNRQLMVYCVCVCMCVHMCESDVHVVNVCKCLCVHVCSVQMYVCAECVYAQMCADDVCACECEHYST